MRKNTKGSTLVAAVAVIMIIMIVLGASLTIASSYYKRSINEITQRQVYLSAKSSAEIVASCIAENERKLIPEEGKTIKINDINIDDEINNYSGYIFRVDDSTIKIVIEARFDEDVSYKIQIVMKQENLLWTTNSYCEAKEGDELC